jgi:hypothetical protein
MTDATVATSNDFGDSNPNDLDRLAASLNHLHAHFCQRAETEAAPSSPDVCEHVALVSDGDPYLGDLEQPADLLDSARLLSAAQAAAKEGNGHHWQASNIR